MILKSLLVCSAQDIDQTKVSFFTRDDKVIHFSVSRFSQLNQDMWSFVLPPDTTEKAYCTVSQVMENGMVMGCGAK